MHGTGQVICIAPFPPQVKMALVGSPVSGLPP